MVRTFLSPARWSAWFALLGLVVLVGCAGPQRIGGGAQDAFERTGRFSLSTEEPGAATQAVQGGFAWLDDGRNLRFDLANPVGSVLARVQVTPGSAVLTRDNGQQERAVDPDALAARVLGQRVPVSGLRHWLRGQVSSSARDVQRDAQGRITAFLEDGWHGALSRFDTHGPQLLRLERTDQGRRVQLRLVIDTPAR